MFSKSQPQCRNDLQRMHPNPTIRWCLAAIITLVMAEQVFAQQPGIQDFQKMKYGLFVHYVWGGTAYRATVNTNGSAPAGLDDLANRFDATGFANDVSSLGVEYVIFTAWHANMNCLWPSPAMNQWLTGHTSQRDLLNDMLTAVRAKGIKVLFYTHPRDGHDLTAAEQLATGWGTNNPANHNFTTNYPSDFNYTVWNNFINELYGDLISRYGNEIEGVYIDEGGNNGAYVDYPRLRSTIKGSNTNLIMIQNYYGSIYTCDLGDIEVNNFGTTNGDVWTAPAMPSSVVMSRTWWASVALGQNTTKYSPAAMFRYTVLKAGISGSTGGTTWAAGPYPGGGWETGVLNTMQTVGAYLASIGPSLTNTYSSTSYVTASGVTLTNLQWGVATRSIDNQSEYIHVLTPPVGNTLILPPPADRKRFGSARLLANGQPVSLAQNNDSVRLTLQGTNTWNDLDTAIELTVTGSQPYSNSTFYDDFSSGSSRWLTTGGTWFVQPGGYCQTNTAAFGYNAAVTQDKWSDATYEFDFQILTNGGNPSNWAGCNVRKTNPTDNHTQSGYLLYFRANGQVCLYKPSGNLTAVNTGLAFTNLTHVKLVTDGPTFTVYLTNSTMPLIICTDSAYVGPGYFSLITGAAGAQFAHVLITPIYGFETPTVSGFQSAPAGGLWTFSATSGIATNGSGITSGNSAAPEGGQVAFLQGNGGCTNTISFDAGQYSVTFAAAQRGNAAQAGQTFNVLLDNTVIGSYAPPSTATNYQDYTTAGFTVAVGDHALALVGSNTRGGNNTILIDNLRFNFAPTPQHTWGGGNGNWSDTNWLPGPVPGPATGTDSVVISSGTVVLNGALAALGAVTLNGGTLAVNEVIGDYPADYNWYGNVQQTTLNAGSTLTLNSFSHLRHLTLAGGVLASSGVDQYHNYGGWYLDDVTMVNGGLTSTISAQQVVLGNGGFQIQTGSVLAVTGSFTGTNGLTLSGGGLLIIATNQAYTGVTTIAGSTLRLTGLQPVAGASRWFDASALNATDGSSISNWPDVSGHNAPAVSLGGHNGNPTLSANAGTGTGRSALHFASGTGGNPATNSQALGFTTDAGIRTLFSVFKGGSFLLTDASAYNFHRPTDTDPTSPLWYSPYASGSILNGSTYVNGTLVNGSTYAMPTNSHNGFNLVEVLTTNSVTASSFNKDRVYHAGDQYQAEVLLYDFPLSSAQRLQNEVYLQAKWFGLGALGNLLPVTTSVSLANSATLDLGGNSQTLSRLSSTDGSGNQVLLGSATLTLSNATDAWFDGVISGAGGLLKQGGGTLTLSGASTFSGPTTLDAGWLRLNGALAGGSVTVGSAAALGGTGVIAGPVTIQTGGTLAPGVALGTLTVSNNLVLSPGSFTTFEIDAAGHCDQVAGLSSVTYGGTLQVTNLAGALTQTNQFKLFSAMGYSGNFTSLSGSPGPGLAYSFHPTNGTLMVVSVTAANPTNMSYSVSGSFLTISWPAAYLGWILQSQTNTLAAGLTTNWVDIAGSSSNTQALLQMNAANSDRFFRLRHP